MNRIRLQFALGLLFVATCSRGQQNVPPAVRGEMPPATSESGLKNVLTGGFSVTSSYDDNALSTVDNHSSDTQFNIAPHVGIQQSRRHFNWSADYAPGFAFSRRFDNRDELTQAVGGGFQFQPTARWSLWARENFTVTTDPFQQLAQDAFLPATQLVLNGLKSKSLDRRSIGEENRKSVQRRSLISVECPHFHWFERGFFPA